MSSQHYLDSSHWIGRLSASIGEAYVSIEDNPKGTRRELHTTLKAFLASSVPSEELAGMLRPYIERKR